MGQRRLNVHFITLVFNDGLLHLLLMTHRFTIIMMLSDAFPFVFHLVIRRRFLIIVTGRVDNPIHVQIEIVEFRCASRSNSVLIDEGIPLR